MPLSRDPVSVQFDQAAADLLRRAYARPGQWVGTYLAVPGPGWIAWAGSRGINLFGRDRWGEIRWVRAFKRSVYYVHRHYYRAGHLELGKPRVSLERTKVVIWQTGRLTARGWAIRVRVDRGGAVAQRAVARLPERRRYIDDDGNATDMASTAADRDW